MVTNHIIPDAFAKTHIGSGSLFKLGEKTERRIFSYNVEPIVTGSIAPVTVLANDTQYIDTSSFDDVRVVASGSGTGSTGGFNIGTHLAFGYVNPEDTTTDNRSRSFDLQPLNSTELSSITFSVIRGNGSNGGETADTGEDLSLWYKNEGDSSFQLAVGGFVTSQSSGFTVLKDVTVNIPAEARTTNTIFRIKQVAASGYQYDHYGITQFVLNDVLSLIHI